MSNNHLLIKQKESLEVTQKFNPNDMDSYLSMQFRQKSMKC